MNTQQSTQPVQENKRMLHTTEPALQRSAAAPAKPPRKPFNPDNDLINVGTRLVEKVVNTRNWEQLRPYLNDANATDEATRKNGTAVLLGIAMRGVQILDQVKAAGIARFTGTDLPTVDGLIYAFKTDQNRFIAMANEVTGLLAKVMKAAPGMKITAPAPTEARQEPAEVEPLKIEITAMPTRETTTNISRDNQGNIISSGQVEFDRK